jgi:hypothetical protein
MATCSTRTTTEHSLASRFGAHLSWANTVDRSARTAPARRALEAKFDQLADPDGTLLPHERAKRAENLRKAHFAQLALKSAQARRRRAGVPEPSETTAS